MNRSLASPPFWRSRSPRRHSSPPFFRSSDVPTQELDLLVEPTLTLVIACLLLAWIGLARLALLLILYLGGFLLSAPLRPSLILSGVFGVLPASAWLGCRSPRSALKWEQEHS